jgi:hypothetical protein
MAEISVNNYLVPAVGTPLAQVQTLDFGGGSTIVLEFRAQKLDGVNFIPTGVFSSVLNSQIQVKVRELNNFQFTLDAGNAYNYPAPPDQTLELTGSGVNTLVFVNYPII